MSYIKEDPNKLNKCTRCGSASVSILHRDMVCHHCVEYAYKCSNCEQWTNYYDTETDARSRWNKMNPIGLYKSLYGEVNAGQVECPPDTYTPFVNRNRTSVLDDAVSIIKKIF